MPIPVHSPVVLLVDDDPQILLGSSLILRSAGIRNVVTMSDSTIVPGYLAAHQVSAIVLDLSMPRIPGCELLSMISEDHPHIPVIIMSAVNELETAVTCMRGGAFDYLLKPVDKSRFVGSVRRALEMSSLREELSSLKQRLLSDTLEHASAFDAIVTRSKRMRAVFQYLEVIAGTDQPVLITGETGVGKDLIARALFDLSGRKGAFVPVNVGGLDDTMFSDTLFGHKKGAFTGADDNRQGLIAKASGGVLFLDEIGDLGEQSQVKLLRLLEDRTYYPLGSDVARHSDARVVVATNCEISAMLDAGTFRKDLYYRLRAHQVHIPPLRERREDIPLLLDQLLTESAERLGRKKPVYSPELLRLLLSYDFPGNVRELRAMVFDAAARSKHGMLSLEPFKETIRKEAERPRAIPVSADEAPALSIPDGRFPKLREAEEFLVQEAMRRSGGNQGLAASFLGISRQALNKRINKPKP